MFPAAGYIAIAGEAARQFSGELLENCILKNFSIISPLFINANANLKLLTRLRTVSSIGDMHRQFELQIMAHEGNRWVQKCTSAVAIHSSINSSSRDIYNSHGPLQRRVAEAYWYDVLESKGLKYGQIFQGLAKISTSVTEHKAVATVSQFEDVAQYSFHPIMIDQCLQILTVAKCQGLGWQLKGPPLITTINHFGFYSPGRSEFIVTGTVTNAESDSFTGDLNVMSATGGSTILAEGCQVSFVLGNKLQIDDRIFSFIKWDNDATYSNLNQMLKSYDIHSALEVLQLLTHKNPRLRILELGNGMQEITRSIVDALSSQSDERHYLTYTCAVTSFDAAFKAKASFKDDDDIDVVFFDMEQQLQSQILSAEAYDLVITTGVWHITLTRVFTNLIAGYGFGKR